MELKILKDLEKVSYIWNNISGFCSVVDVMTQMNKNKEIPEGFKKAIRERAPRYIPIIQLKKELGVKWIKELQRFKEFEMERNEIENKFHKSHPDDWYSNEYYETCVDPYQKKDDELTKKFEEIGIKFACVDNGGDYCLSPEGLILVLKIIFNITKKDLKKEK